MTPTAAARWIQAHHRSYLEQTLRCPHNAHARTYTDLTTFCAHLRPWTPEERRELRRVVQRVADACWSWRPLLAQDRWTFILCDDSLEAGMPHTIHTAIMMPTWWLAHLLRDTATPTAHRAAIETLVHERIHVLQKRYPRTFADLYRRWGYRSVDTLSTDHPAHRAIARAHAVHAHRTNPDTPGRWLWRERWYPFVALRDPSQLGRGAYGLIGCGIEDTGPAGNAAVAWHDQATHSAYRAYHGTRAHCYHPDETSAVLLAAEAMADYAGGHTGNEGGDDTREGFTECPALVALRQWCVAQWHWH